MPKKGNIISSYFTKTPRATGKDVYDEGNRELIGQVEKVHFIDDPTNKSKKFVEYDVSVKDAYGGQSLYKNVRSGISVFGGTNDHEEIILEPNDYAFSGNLNSSNLFENKNGTIVVLSFLDGSLDKPYISTTLGHPRKEGPRRAKGIHRAGEFRGVAWEIDKEGAWSVIYQGNRNPDGSLARADTGPTSMSVDSQGDFELSNNASQAFTMSRTSGKVTITDGSTTVDLDSNSDTILMTTASGATIEINGSSQQITLTAGSAVIEMFSGGKINITGNFVDVGEAASALAALGPQLISYLATHTHISPFLGIPTSPPTVPPPVSMLSTSVRIKA